MQSINIINMAYAKIKGSKKYPNLYGNVSFKQMRNGVLVKAEIFGLPHSNCSNGIFGFHIHEGEDCTENENSEYVNADNHYNNSNCEHPYHSGDMPPLFGNNGYAYLSFFTNRFNINEITGKVVIIHQNADDLKTNPSGNSGEKIACGKIYK